MTIFKESQMSDFNNIVLRLGSLSTALNNMKSEIDDIYVQMANLQASGALQSTEAPAMLPVAEVRETPSAPEPAVRIDERAVFLAMMVRFFSPKVFKVGQGIIAPGCNDVNDAMFNVYRDDVRRVSTDKLRKWPCGFYRNRDTQAFQFFYKTAKHWLIADFSENPENGSSVEEIAIIFVNEDGTLPLIRFLELTDEQLNVVNKDLYEALQNLANLNIPL